MEGITERLAQKISATAGHSLQKLPVSVFLFIILVVILYCKVPKLSIVTVDIFIPKTLVEKKFTFTTGHSLQYFLNYDLFVTMVVKSFFNLLKVIVLSSYFLQTI